MNTPTHVVLSAVVLGRGTWQRLWAPIVAGALLPDLPMLLFYGYQRLVLASPERRIWSQTYFEPSWQLFFDAFNSLPLIGLAALVAWRLGHRAGLALCASMALHCVADLLVHHDDAHRHFLPISGWRFASPVSYWDPRHFGQVFLVAEAASVLVGAAYLVLSGRPKALRVLGACVLGAYAAFAAYAWTVWGPLGGPSPGG